MGDSSLSRQADRPGRMMPDIRHVLQVKTVVASMGVLPSSQSSSSAGFYALLENISELSREQRSPHLMVGRFFFCSLTQVDLLPRLLSGLLETVGLVRSAVGQMSELYAKLTPEGCIFSRKAKNKTSF